jgi:hypothetical protein
VGGSPRSREPMASSSSHRLSFSTGWPISCRRRGSTGGPPTDWGELVQVHDDREIFQGRIDELPAIDIHSL